MLKILQKQTASDLWLFAGLGNPGDKYARNRHNIGFMAIDAVADGSGAPPFKTKFQGQVSEAALDGVRTILLKPLTMMNLSGQSVAAAAKFYKIPPARIVVFHDELDLPPGKIRVKRGGGAAGHNGLRSIDDHLGQEYWRVRMGIGHPGDRDRVHGYVLGDFSKADADWLEPLLAATAKHASLFVRGKESEFMSKVAMAGNRDI